MAVDVIDLRTFYGSPLGQVTELLLQRAVCQLWTSCAGYSVLGIGYAIPYLEPLRANAVRTLAFMPAEQGVVNWPTNAPSASALVDLGALPLPDSCIDRVLVVHALENNDHPYDMLAEIWRILTPGGRMILVAPNRSGVWARFDTTPFGQGQPYSRSQLRSLMRQALFSPIHWGEALYAPPFERRVLLRSAPALESLGRKLSLPGAGVHIVEATKQLYQPIALRRSVRTMAQWRPVLTSPGRALVSPGRALMEP
jgi:SAM-dependent methyltransferase